MRYCFVLGIDRMLLLNALSTLHRNNLLVWHADRARADALVGDCLGNINCQDTRKRLADYNYHDWHGKIQHYARHQIGFIFIFDKR